MNHTQLNHARQTIQADIDSNKMYGANLIVAQKGEIILRESFGTIDGKQPMNLNNVFLMMSVSKSFTAVLTLKAIEQGRFTLDTKIGEICPEFNAHNKEKISVFHILTHQAGMYKLPFVQGMNPADVGNIDKAFATLCDMPADFEAGTQSHYSSFLGYAVLGKILETTDPKGRTFAQIAQDELFKPLNIQMQFGNAIHNPNRVPVSHTDVEKAKGDALVGNLAGVEQFLNGLANANQTVPAGNAFGTIDDLFGFAESMRLDWLGKGKRILSPAMMKYATQNHCGTMLNESVRAEWERLHLSPLLSHFGLHGGYVRGNGHLLSMCGSLASPNAFGGMGGGSTAYLIDPERELTVAFLSAGFMEGLAHLLRVSKLNDLIIGACE